MANRISSVVHFKVEKEYSCFPNILCNRYTLPTTILQTTTDKTKVTCGLCYLSLKGV